ncbi:MAG: protein kinase [Planctomycetaceae bacterium]
MLICHQCRQKLTDSALAVGRCSACGVEIAAHVKVTTPLGTFEPADRSPFSAAEVEENSDQALETHAAAGPPDTIASESIEENDAGMTAESALPEPMRTLDADQTLGMDDELLPAQAGDATYIEGAEAGEAVDPDRTLGMNDEQLPPVDDGGATFVEAPISSPGRASQRAQNLDPDRTFGMNDEELPPQAGDATMIEAPSPAAQGAGTEVSDPQETPGLSSAPRRSLPSESKLVIHSRSLSRRESQVAPPDRPDYEIVKKLGEGGMGVVWLARQASLNREVAIKQIRLDKLKSTAARSLERERQAFLAEAIVTGRLSHPNIVPIHDLGTDDDGSLLYSMKSVSGVSWDKVIGSNTLEQNLEILSKVCDGIAYAHGHGVVHRDLKPSNIMVADFGEVLVMDWGTALPLARFPKPMDNMATAGRAGTPAYMPPEQAEGDLAKIGPYSDIYLLGAILFEIVTGVPPHPMRAENGGSLTTRELLQNAQTNRIVSTSASGELLDIARKALASSPDDRYRTVADFQEALKSYQRHSESVQLTMQARQDLDDARQSADYSRFASAVFGFENALKFWDANSTAQTGLVDARLDYANAALQKQDFDLGLTLVDDTRPEYVEVHKQLIAGREDRRRRIARLRTARWTVASLAVLLLAGGLTFGTVIYRQREGLKLQVIETDRQRGIAEENEKTAQRNEVEALKQKQLAEDNEQIAKINEIEAVKQKRLAEENEKTAQTNEAEAIKQKRLAEENAEIARRNEAEAVKQKAIAEENERIAQAEKAKAEAAAEAERLAKTAAIREWYYSQINLADQQIAQNAFDGAREILRQIDLKLSAEKQLAVQTQQQGQPVPAGLIQEIGWEFQRLKYLCDLAHDELISPGPDRVALTAVAASPRQLATADLRGTVQLWNSETRKPNGAPLKVSGQPQALAFSPDEALLAVGTNDGVISLWDAQTGESRGLLKGHEDAVTRLLFLPEGPLVSASRDHTVRVWDPVRRDTVSVLKGHVDAVLSLVRLEDAGGRTLGLLSGDSNRGEVRYWKMAPPGETWPSVSVLNNEESAVSALAAQISKSDGDSLFVFVGSDDGSLKAMRYSLKSIETALREARDGKPVPAKAAVMLTRDFSERHRGGITGLLIDPLTQQLISSSRDNTIRSWNIQEAALINEGRSLLVNTLRGHGNAIVDLAAWHDDKARMTWLLTAGADGTARLWNPQVSLEVVTLGGETLDRDTGYGDILSLAAGGPLADRIIGGSRNGVTTIWDVPRHVDDVRKRPPVTLREGHRFQTQSAVFLQDLLITVSFDGTAVAWDRQTGAMVHGWRDVGFSGLLAGSADARFVATEFAPPEKSADNLQLWSLVDDSNAPGVRRTFAVGQTIKRGNRQIADQPACAAFSPSGARLVVGTENGFLQTIDPVTDVLTRPISAHPLAQDSQSPVPESVTGVAFLGEHELASVGLDGALRFWTISAAGELAAHPTRKELLHVDAGVVHRVKRIAASADGRRVATWVKPGNRDGKPDPKCSQIWISDLTETAAVPRIKLQPWQANGGIEEKVLSMSLSADGQNVLAAVEMPIAEEGRQQKRRIVLREWSLSDANHVPQSREVLATSRGFDFDQAAYLPGQVNQVALLSNSLTYIRKRASRQDNFDEPPVAVYGPVVALQACDLSHDGKLAVTASDELAAPEDSQRGPRLHGEIRLWDVSGADARRIGQFLLEGTVQAVAICPTDSNLLLVGGRLPSAQGEPGYVGALYRWNGNRWELEQQLKGHPRGIIRARFSADGQRLFTASVDGTVRLFKKQGAAFEEQQPIVSLSDPSRQEMALQDLVAADLSDNGHWLVAADKNAAVVIDVATGNSLLKQKLQGHSRDMTDVRFASRNDVQAPERLWTTSLDGTVKFWAVSIDESNSAGEQSGTAIPRSLLTLRGHQGGVLAMTPLPNGGVVTAGTDGRVILWPIHSTTTAE